MQHLAHMLLRNEISEAVLIRLCWLILDEVFVHDGLDYAIPIFSMHHFRHSMVRPIRHGKPTD
jgi:hypothetical protein